MTQLSRMLPLLSILAILTSFAYHPSYALKCERAARGLTNEVRVPQNDATNAIIWRSGAQIIPCERTANDPRRDKPIQLQLTPILGRLDQGIEFGIEYLGQQYWGSHTNAINIGTLPACHSTPCPPPAEPILFDVLLRKTGPWQEADMPTSYPLFNVSAEGYPSQQVQYTQAQLQQIKPTQSWVEIVSPRVQQVVFEPLQSHIVKEAAAFNSIAHKTISIELKRHGNDSLAVSGLFRAVDGYVPNNPLDKCGILKNTMNDADSGVCVVIHPVAGQEAQLANFERVHHLTTFEKGSAEQKKINFAVVLHRSLAPVQTGPFHGAITLHLVYE